MRVLVSFVAAVLAVSVGPAPRGETQPGDWLPDLQTAAPFEVSVMPSAGGGRELRFSVSFSNLGRGPLELRPVHEGTTTRAVQVVYGAGGRVTRERDVGSFEFHAEHDHWHLADYASYELRQPGAAGRPGRVVASSTKVSFCIVDVRPVFGTGPPPRYRTCGRDNVQGLTQGWSDVYVWQLAGQSIDLEGVRNGVYWLVAHTDPLDRIDERVEDNNVGKVLVRIRGDRVFAYDERVRGGGAGV